jgi:hypothetical protein
MGFESRSSTVGVQSSPLPENVWLLVGKSCGLAWNSKVIQLDRKGCYKGHRKQYLIAKYQNTYNHYYH